MSGTFSGSPSIVVARRIRYWARKSPKHPFVGSFHPGVSNSLYHNEPGDSWTCLLITDEDDRYEITITKKERV